RRQGQGRRPRGELRDGARDGPHGARAAGAPDRRRDIVEDHDRAEVRDGCDHAEHRAAGTGRGRPVETRTIHADAGCESSYSSLNAFVTSAAFFASTFKTAASPD